MKTVIAAIALTAAGLTATTALAENRSIHTRAAIEAALAEQKAESRATRQATSAESGSLFGSLFSGSVTFGVADSAKADPARGFSLQRRVPDGR